MTATATKTSLTKWIHAASNFIALIPSRSVRQILAFFFFGVEFYITVAKFRKRKRKSLSLFTSSSKREIGYFHVVVVQWWQRNVLKSVMHVQSCCFANLNRFLFFPFSLMSPLSSLLKLPDGWPASLQKQPLKKLRDTIRLQSPSQE